MYVDESNLGLAATAHDRVICHNSKNPGPCGNRTFPSEVHHQNLESTQLPASCFPGPDDAPRWEMYDFRTGMGSCFIITRSKLKVKQLSKHLMN